MTQSSTLTITDTARVMAHRLLAGADTWLPVPGGCKAMTAPRRCFPRGCEMRSRFAMERPNGRRRGSSLPGLDGFMPFCLLGYAMLGPIRRPNNALPEGRSRTSLPGVCNRFWTGRSALGRWPV